MKVLFKNKTTYTKATYDKFLAFHSKKYHFSYTAYTALVVAFILFGLVLQVKAHNFTLAIVLCCSLTAFVLWRFFRPISDVSKEYKSEKIQKEKQFTFKFYHKFFTIEDEKEYSKMKYYQLYKVFETADFFYLYIDKTHALLLDKTKFKKNNPSEFLDFIKRKCWWCYKKVK
ncbi:MAG: YcxB family protein [Clostridia bacterium]|nr:YcxB family protein [Clostridia bacterium]